MLRSQELDIDGAIRRGKNGKPYDRKQELVRYARNGKGVIATRNGARIEAQRKALVRSPAHNTGTLSKVHHKFLQVFSDHCYEPGIFQYGQGRKTRTPIPDIILIDAPEDDIVARLENAALMGLNIPDDTPVIDILAAFIPNRRVVAFAYACLIPQVGDNYAAACRLARIPYGEFINTLYVDARVLPFVAEFWRIRKSSVSGVAFLYADRYAKGGSIAHLKAFTDLTGLTKETEQKNVQAIQINMPGAGAPPGMKALPPAEEGDDFSSEPE